MNYKKIITSYFCGVKNIETILESYKASPNVRQIQGLLSEGPQKRFLLRGLIGSMDAFIVSSLFSNQPCQVLFIADDKDDAAYTHNNIANLLENKIVHFFPDSFKRPKNFENYSNSNALLRTETINKITSSNSVGEIIVTYPEALFEKVVRPDILRKNQIIISKNELVDVDTIIEVLASYGFKREEFVYEPGQFSVRGGIIDIFSYGNEFPFRVELFDEEVESIRTFNPSTQLSISNIAKVTIIPNINTKFNREDKDSLLEILNKDTVVWIRDPEKLIRVLSQCFEKAEEFAKSVSVLDESELAEIFRDKAFIKPDEVVEKLEPFHIGYLNDSRDFNLPTDKEFKFNAKSRPNINKNFNLLIEILNANTQNQIDNYIFIENPKQVERFYAIFEDLKSSVNFQPIIKVIHEGFIDLDLKIACFTDHEIFDRFHRYRIRQGFSQDQALTMKMLRDLKPGDFVTHLDHGIGRFSGLEKININGHIQESVRLIYKNNDILYVSINSLHKIAKYSGKEGAIPKLSKLGSDTWKNLKRKTKNQVKDIASELIKLYAKRKSAPGFSFPKDSYLQNELEASFIYEDTPDQLKATKEVKEDMSKAYPMDRLICGDVGFGKTEVAIRAAFKAVDGGKQVAVLVPTTILAIQHYKTFNERLNEFGVSVDYINRFRTAKEKKEIFEKLEEGKLEIIIGTHGLLGNQIKFKDLGLLIIDEEQKFGVAAKEKLRQLKVNVDTLTLTATPIPRTLQFSLMAARDLSVIRTPPPNRQPINTELRVFNEELIKDVIDFEVHRGGQVFFVHNRVKTLPEVTIMLRRLCPNVDIASAHGQMDSKDLEKTLLDFIDGRFDVLVCTNIIETGLDIPNANTMIINDAHFFGISDLHQLRGRVGRSNKKAFCYLFTPPLSTLTTDAKKRLKTLEEFSDLGSGFNIAMRDLDIRGAGNLLGAEQSGFITDIGYQTYQKILEEAILELKEKDFKDLFKEELGSNHSFVRDVQIDTDVEMLIPDEYVESIQERLSLYTELDSLETEEDIEKFEEKLRDRFGKIPAQVYELFNGLRLRWVCKVLGFSRIILKGNKLRCYFVEDPQSPFYESENFHQILNFVTVNGDKLGFSFKKSNTHFVMVKDGVRSLKSAMENLKQIEDHIVPKAVEN